MYFGFFASLSLHLGLLAWALLSFASTEPLKPPQARPVEVSIITDDDLVRLKKGDRDSKKLKTRAAEKPEKTNAKKPTKKVERRAAPPPPPAALPEPEPAKPKAEVPKPKPEPAKPKSDPIANKIAALSKPALPDPNQIALKKAEEAKKKAEAEAKKKAEEAKRKAAEEAKRKAEEEAKRKAEAERKRKAEDKRRKALARKRRLERIRKRKLAEKRRKAREAAERKKNAFDPGRIAALLNKVPDNKQPLAGSERNNRKLPRGAEAGAPEGKDTRLTAGQVQMIGVMMENAVKRCWNINSGLEGAENLAIVVRIRLKPNGQLDGRPQVMNRRNSPHFADAADAALRAVIQCAPYDLPKELYKGGWDFMELSFDPRKMF